MMTATTVDLSDLLSDGQLGQAHAQAAAAVKANPNRSESRLMLAELSAIMGDLEKADLHARLAQRVVVGGAAPIGVFRHILRGLDARVRWWRDGAVPGFPGEPTAADRAALVLNVALRDGLVDAARAAADVLEVARGATPARWNDIDLADLRDLDDRLPHALEVVTAGGAYLWVDMARVARIAFQRPVRPFDLCCRAARLEMRDGGVADVWLPVIYPDPADSEQRLARVTAFASIGGGLMRGAGQRLFLADAGPDAEAVAFLDAGEITFGGGNG